MRQLLLDKRFPRRCQVLLQQQRLLWLGIYEGVLRPAGLSDVQARAQAPRTVCYAPICKMCDVLHHHHVATHMYCFGHQYTSCFSFTNVSGGHFLVILHFIWLAMTTSNVILQLHCGIASCSAQRS
jgi:hypothetical protein